MSTSVRSSHPISFSLLNKDHQPVLDILDDSEGQDLRLEITNSSQRDLQLAKLPSTEAGPVNHHFELKFRPGVLSSQAKTPITIADDEWAISKPDQPNGTVSLYLLSKKGATLKAGSAVSLTLQHVAAEGAGGARGTRVELRYGNESLKYSSANQTSGLVAGQREQHLSIVNQRGKKLIPLHLGFVGSNTILNDGSTPNVRTLKITNTSKIDKLPLNANTKFILSFDVYDPKEQNDWALGTSSAVQAIEVDAVQSKSNQEIAELYRQALASFSPQPSPDHLQKLGALPTDLDRMNYLIDKLGGHIKDAELTSANPQWKVVKNAQDTTVEWTITPAKDKVFLERDESIQLRLTGIVSSMRSGPANVYLRYENIGGYWDGQFVTSLEKTRMVQRDQVPNGLFKHESYVGIGTNDPKSHLDVNGVANIWSGEHYAASNGRMKPGSLTIGSCSAGYGGSTRAWDDNNTAGLLLETQNNTEIAVHNHNKRLASLMYYEGGDVNRITIGRNMGNDSLATLAINGNVGIGTTDPKSKLQVAGDTLVEGKAGIGKANPDYKLDVYGPAAAFPARVASPDGELLFGPLNPGWSHFMTDRPRFFFNRGLTVDPGNIGSFNGDLNLQTSGTTRLTIENSSGDVGIGTTTPEGHLEIKNGRRDWMILRQERSADAGGFRFHNPWGDHDGGERNRLEIAYQSADGNTRWGQFVIHGPSGFVGIGKEDPAAPLHVGLRTSMTRRNLQDQFAYLSYEWHSNKSNDYHLGLSNRFGDTYTFSDTSITAEGRVVATEFNAFSDSRIKKNSTVSDPLDDLKLLKQLRVIDYEFKDSLAHGNRHSKGFIAEEVEELFPQCVSKRGDFIPNIYAFAQQTTLDDEVLTVGLPETHGLAEGDKVRLMTESDVKEVSVSVIDDKTFSVDRWQGTVGKLFVHGKKVDDFRTLDYQQIFSLGISGIQQLAHEMDELKAANEALQKKLQLLESRFESISGFAVPALPPNGNGKH